MGLTYSLKEAATYEDAHRLDDYVDREETYVLNTDIGKAELENQYNGANRTELTPEEYKEQFEKPLEELNSLLEDLEIDEDEFKTFLLEEKLDEKVDKLDIENRQNNPFAIRQDLNAALKTSTNFEDFRTQMMNMGHTVTLNDGLIIDNINTNNLSTVRNKDGSETNPYSLEEIDKRLLDNKNRFETQSLGTARCDLNRYWINANNEWARKQRYLRNQQLNLISIRGIKHFFESDPMEQCVLLVKYSIKFAFSLLLKIKEMIDNKKTKDQFFKRKEEIYNQMTAYPNLKIEDALRVIDKYQIGTPTKAELILETLNYESAYLREKISTYNKELFKLKKKLPASQSQYDYVEANLIALKADLKQIENDSRQISNAILPFIKDMANNSTPLTKELERTVKEYKIYCEASKDADMNLIKEIRNREKSYADKHIPTYAKEKFQDINMVKDEIKRLEIEKSRYVKLSKCQKDLTITRNVINPDTFVEEVERELQLRGKNDPTRQRIKPMILTTSPRDRYVSPEEMKTITEYFIDNCPTLSKCMVKANIHTDHLFNDEYNPEAKNYKSNLQSSVHAHISIGSPMLDGRLFNMGQGAIKRGDMGKDDYLQQAYMADLEFRLHSSAQHQNKYLEQYEILTNPKKLGELTKLEQLKLMIQTGIATDAVQFKKQDGYYVFKAGEQLFAGEGNKIEDAINNIQPKIPQELDLTVIAESIILKAQDELQYSTNSELAEEFKPIPINLTKRINQEINKQDLTEFFKANILNTEVLSQRVASDLSDILTNNNPRNKEELCRLMKERGYSYTIRDTSIQFTPKGQLSKARIKEYNEKHPDNPYVSFPKISTAKLGDEFSLSNLQRMFNNNYTNMSKKNPEIENAINRLKGLEAPTQDIKVEPLQKKKKINISADFEH